ncbi:MAG: SDR family NAD(P)-dependent oxidoreductase [Dehalococcoidia bacterium]
MLEGKAVIVTGAGSGIGRSAAQLMSKAGARVLISDVNEGGLRDTAALVMAAGGTVELFRADISKENEARSMVDAAVSAFGRLDGAFNNAAIAQLSIPLHELPTEVWQRNIDINLTGTFFCMKYEIIAMLRNGGGSIVNTSSAAGVNAFPLAPEYCSSKHGVIGLTRNAALDYGGKSIRVNAVLPGAVRTPMLMKAMTENPGMEEYLRSIHPLGRYGEPEEIAQAALWLLSDAASFITGAAIPVDGGYTTH